MRVRLSEEEQMVNGMNDKECQMVNGMNDKECQMVNGMNDKECQMVNGIPCSIVLFMHAGCCKTFGKRKCMDDALGAPFELPPPPPRQNAPLPL